MMSNKDEKDVINIIQKAERMGNPQSQIKICYMLDCETG